MVLFLNYLPWMLFSAALYLTYLHYRKEWSGWLWQWLVVAVLLTLALQALSNSGVIPRGGVEPLPTPAFDESKQEVQDRLRKPERNTEESDERLKSLSEWRKKENSNEQR